MSDDILKNPPEIYPTAGKLLVKQLDAEERSAGGLFLPDISKERPPEGLVVRVGAEVEQLKAGDRVVFRKWSSKAWVDHDSGLLIVDAGEALAIRK